MADTPPTADTVRKALALLADPTRAEGSRRFFRTGPGEYGEGDRFLGVTVPSQRVLAKNFETLPFTDIESLLQSPVHEERLTALFVLVRRYERSRDAAIRDDVVALYRRNLAWVNNWDLVDSSAPQILGASLLDGDRHELDRLAVSPSLWSRRIAIVATYAFILRGEWKDTVRIAEVLLHDDEDLIHKAVGWMLREVGKRCDETALGDFLAKHAAVMPRTMLRYAIERLPPSERKRWLAAGTTPARGGRRGQR